jgi:glycosyltransferase involved in cell wall biosynthesis
MPLSDKKASIVIPAFNSEKTIFACLSACVGQASEIIVVDDGSTDATPDIVKTFPVTLLRQKTKGPAAARNAGWRKASGEIIFFTDSDCVPEAGWVGKLLTLLAQTNADAAGGGYSYSGNSPLGKWIHAEIRARHARMKGTVNFLGSFNLAVRRKTLERVHGFDEGYRKPSAEDNDLCYRLKKTGCRLVFDPGITVDHLHPWGVRRYLKVQMRHGFWRAKLYLGHPEMARGDAYAKGLSFIFPPKGTGCPPRFYPLIVLRALARLFGFFSGFVYWRISRRAKKA